MGLGKTFVGSEKMLQLGSGVNLIVCQKSKIDDWRNHFADFYKYDISAYDLTKKQQWDDFWNNPCGFRHQVGIINYELAWRRKDLLQLSNFTLMLDESSLIQNTSAKQTKFILKLRPSNVILLSGTPVSGKYENLWTQMRLLGWNISHELYDRQYVNYKKIEVGGFIHKVVDKENPYRNVERLKQKMREHGAVFLKTEECFKLPEQNFIPVNVPAPKEYKKFMRTGITVIDGAELVGDTTLTKRIRARQLCGMYNKAKLDAFTDLAASTNDRLIVFYNFQEEYEQLKGICETLERPISVLNGSDKDLSAYEDESDSITLIQYQAGAMGVNLQKANKVVYFTPTERCELWMQSQKRIHRIGQEKPCFYYKLICKDSIEEAIYRALERGVDYTDELFKKFDG